MMSQPGDRVKVITKKGEEEGILMPTPDQKVVIIKLDNGYNLGFEKKDVTEINVLEKKKEPTEPKKKVSKNETLPTIVILHTGGTIASKVDYKTGAVTAKFTAEDLLEMFPELQEHAQIETELVSNMMSEDMALADYQKIAQAVQKQAEKKIAGIIIGHGTDTLSYTSAALAFMFEKINLPVLLVGSQRSTDRGSTDALQNLVCATKFITKTDFAGVAVCMHNSSSDDQCAILPATKTRKMHTSRRDAFQAINADPIALVDYNSDHIKFLQPDYSKKNKSKIILQDKFENDVALLKVHPNMHPCLFEFYTKHYKAIVIEGTGLGHAPTNLGENNLKNYELLKQFIKNGGIVAITSQCLFGAVHHYVYTNLRRLAEIGCIFCHDMLPETAFIKLSWLMGNYPVKDVKKLLNKNLRGEINERLTYDPVFVKR